MEDWEADQDQVDEEEDQDLQLEIQKVRCGHVVRSVRLSLKLISREARIFANVGVTCFISYIKTVWLAILHYQSDQNYQKGHSLGINETSKSGEC